MEGFHRCLLLILALVGSLENLNLVCSAADLTDGFTPVPLTEANFELQKPYNIPLNDEDGGRHMWVYATDKPHDPNSRTQPRTEVHMKVLDYTSGAWQFEGYGFLPNGTSGVTVAQMHGAAEDASTLILRVYDGNFRYHSGDLVATGLYDRWFRLNIIHDVDGDWVTVDVDGEQKYSTKGRGPGDLYFKCGVYAAPRHITYYMESRWRDIKLTMARKILEVDYRDRD